MKQTYIVRVYREVWGVWGDTQEPSISVSHHLTGLDRPGAVSAVNRLIEGLCSPYTIEIIPEPQTKEGRVTEDTKILRG